MQLDHIMYATSDLDLGIEEVKDLTGVTAEFSGSHPGGGTRNALLSFENNQYLEIIAPDPAQSLEGNLGGELTQYKVGGIRTWAAATDNYDALIPILDAHSYGHNIISMERTRPDGVLLQWQILFVTGHPFDNRMPFFINWLGSPHPALTSPKGCTLSGFSVELLEHHDQYRRFMQAVGLDVEVLEGPDAMRAVLESPKGKVMLH